MKLQILDKKYNEVRISLCSVTGSRQFGTSNDKSDIDIFGIFIPKNNLYYTSKSIVGLDEIKFRELIEEKSELYDNVPHDIKLFNIVRFYKLIKYGNIDCVTFLYSDNFLRCDDYMKKLVDWRDNFITKKMVSAALYYGLSQLQNLKKVRNFTKKENIDRCEKYGYDTKAAGHAVRLIECSKFMIENGTCDPTYNNKFIRSIREGVYTKDEIIEYVEKKQIEYRKLLDNCNLLNETPVELITIVRDIFERYSCETNNMSI